MSSNIKKFKSRAEFTSKKNLNGFIKNSREHLTVFGTNTWHENKWHTFNGKRKVVVRFSTNLKPFNSYHFEPMQSPFLEFAKAYIKDLYTDNPVKNLQRQMEALRLLEEALILVHGKADILLLDGAVLAQLYDIFQNRLNDPVARNKVGYQMELICNFCREEFFVTSLPLWSNPFQKVRDLTIATDDKGKELRAEKLPTNEEMMLVADLFHKAPQLGVEAEYFTSIYALLMAAPSRASEQTTLPVDCLVWEENRAGEKKLGIRWVPAKSGKIGIKWVPTAMQEVVVEAIKRLKRIGAPARKAAKFAEQNPKQFMLHGGCITDEKFPSDKFLSIDQFNAALSTKFKRFSAAPPTPKWLMKLIRENSRIISYNTLGEHEYEKYTQKFPLWPFVDEGEKVKVSDALLLHRENEFHEEFNPRGFSFCIPTLNHINDRFIQSSAKKGRTLWEKHGFFLKSEKSISLPTHSARHWLSTIAERGGMDELTLAHWAGRAFIGDNPKYNNQTEEEKAERLAMLMVPKSASVLDKIKHRIPVMFHDIGKELDGQAIVTELGVCEHDYAISPCQSIGDCETCKELVCIKGFSNSLELLKKREKEVEQLLEKAMHDRQKVIQGGGKTLFGSDRWISNHGWRLSHLRTKIRLLEDENTPKGALIRVPEEYDPSPVKETLRAKGLQTEIIPPESIEISDDIFKLMEL